MCFTKVELAVADVMVAGNGHDRHHRMIEREQRVKHEMKVDISGAIGMVLNEASRHKVGMKCYRDAGLTNLLACTGFMFH